MTQAQKRLVEEVRNASPARYGLSVCRNGFKTADVLIAQGILKDVTERATDFTRFVVLSATAR